MTISYKKTLITGKQCDGNNNFVTKETIGTDYSYKHTIVWKNAIGFLILHLVGVCGGAYYVLTGQVMAASIMWTFIFGYLSSEGVTIGSHRYYTHRTFKAKLPLQILLAVLQTATGQNSIFIWARDHRLHHRYSDTDADPHNAKRGFFFSHIGWLMCKKHPYVIELGRKIDMSDLQADPIVQFQKKYYYYLYIFIAILLPVSVPVYFWNEDPMAAFIICYFSRYVYFLNGTWLVNSAAHLYGTRPYDKNLQPVESWFVSFLSLGEGWHNYHHAFPWDYKAAELSRHFNFSATLIRFFERIGLAYDLKSVSKEVLEKRIMRTGDGTHFELGDDVSRAAVTAIGPLHPMNPTYTTTRRQPDVQLSEGFPLFHEKDILNQGC